MALIINGINFNELEAMKYYAPPASWPSEKKQDNAKMKIFSGDWIGSEKKDGYFSKFVKDNDGICYLYSRSRGVNGQFANKIDYVPHLQDFFNRLPNGTCLLAELYLPSAPGSSNITSILGCLKEKAIERQKKTPLYFYVFDVLAWNGETLIKTPIIKRINYLTALPINGHKFIKYATYYSGEELWDTLGRVFAAGGEGIVITKKDAAYEPGKRSAKVSLKIKKEIQQTIDCFFTGRATAPTRLYSGKEIEIWPYWINKIDESPLSEDEHYSEYIKGEPIEPVTKPYYYKWAGSLEIGVMKNGKIIPIGYLSGLTDEIKANFRDYAMKPIEVTAMEVLKTGGLRHAKFIQFRPELNIEDCTWEKIFG